MFSIVGQPPLRLVKFCEEKHNLARGCNTIAIGTTRYYKDLEAANPTSDPEESIAIYNQRWISPDGKTRMYNNTVIMAMPNTYCFCMSHDDVSTFKGYPDRYYINNPELFFSIINNEFVKALRPDDFLSGKFPEVPFNAMRVGTYVMYEKGFQLYGEMKFNTTAYENSIFRKNQSYKNEREFRLAWILKSIVKQNGVLVEKYYDIRNEVKIINVADSLPQLRAIISLE